MFMSFIMREAILSKANTSTDDQPVSVFDCTEFLAGLMGRLDDPEPLRLWIRMQQFLNLLHFVVLSCTRWEYWLR